MRQLVMMGAVALALAGCASASADRDATAMRGQPISAAIKRYGYPDAEDNIAGHHIYRWHRQNQRFVCDLVVEVDPSGAITEHTINDQVGACNTF